MVLKQNQYISFDTPLVKQWFFGSGVGRYHMVCTKYFPLMIPFQWNVSNETEMFFPFYEETGYIRVQCSRTFCETDKRTSITVWSRYGMCIDINECAANLEICDVGTETCVNLPGRHKCICRWGFTWSAHQRSCVRDEAVNRANIRLVVTADTLNLMGFVHGLRFFHGLQTHQLQT